MFVIFPPRISKTAHPWWGKTVNSKCSTLVGKMLQKISSPPTLTVRISFSKWFDRIGFPYGRLRVKANMHETQRVPNVGKKNTFFDKNFRFYQATRELFKNDFWDSGDV